jgi:hypothetical protein
MAPGKDENVKVMTAAQSVKSTARNLQSRKRASHPSFFITLG